MLGSLREGGRTPEVGLDLALAHQAANRSRRTRPIAHGEALAENKQTKLAIVEIRPLGKRLQDGNLNPSGTPTHAYLLVKYSASERNVSADWRVVS
jgi:hypothetical protein